VIYTVDARCDHEVYWDPLWYIMYCWCTM